MCQSFCGRRWQLIGFDLECRSGCKHKHAAWGPDLSYAATHTGLLPVNCTSCRRARDRFRSHGVQTPYLGPDVFIRCLSCHCSAVAWHGLRLASRILSHCRHSTTDSPLHSRGECEMSVLVLMSYTSESLLPNWKLLVKRGIKSDKPEVVSAVPQSSFSNMFHSLPHWYIYNLRDSLQARCTSARGW